MLGLVNGLLVVVGADPGDHRDAGDARHLPRASPSRSPPATRSRRSSSPDSFLNLASRKPLGLPMLAWFAVVVAIVGVGGAALDARGGATSTRSARTPRPLASPASRAGRRVILAFTLCGALAGLGGFLWASRFPNVDAVAATDFELDVITAVVIGGVNVFGGSGHDSRRRPRRRARRDDPGRLHAAAPLRVLEDVLQRRRDRRRDHDRRARDPAAAGHAAAPTGGGAGRPARGGRAAERRRHREAPAAPARSCAGRRCSSSPSSASASGARRSRRSSSRGSTCST